MPSEYLNPIEQKDKAIVEIMAIKQQAQKGGNIEDEAFNFDQLILNVKEGVLTPEHAVEKARYMLEKRDEI